MKNHRMSTACIHAGGNPDEKFGGVSVPIYQSSTFSFADAAEGAARFSGQDAGYKYTRIGNPTVSALQDCLAELESGAAALATASGMAAISTIFMTFLSEKSHVVSTNSVYGPTRTILANELSRFGVKADFVESSNTENVKRAVRPETKIIYLETPANPTLSISDIKECSKIAKQAGALLVVDNTFCSPVLQRPLELGADIVLHSMTKFLNGHSDVVAGMIVANTKELVNRMHKVLCQFGGTIDPHQAWLVLRGIKTLAMRIDAAQKNAIKIAQDLQNHPKIEWVKFPGLKSHEQYELAQNQMDGPGAMISFEVKGGLEAGEKLMNAVKVSTLAVSLGGIESLIQHPASMTHASMGPEARKEAEITDGLVRFSVGCEDYQDLIDDLFRALDEI